MILVELLSGISEFGVVSEKQKEPWSRISSWSRDLALQPRSWRSWYQG